MWRGWDVGYSGDKAGNSLLDMQLEGELLKTNTINYWKSLP